MADNSGKHIQSRRRGNELSWSDLGVRVGEKDLLKHVKGHAAPFEVTGIIGPSGSGKSVLLKALSGRFQYTGEIFFDRQLQSSPLAFVGHQYPLEPTSTVFEAIYFAAVFRLPPTEQKDLERRVRDIIEDLRLCGCANTQARYLSDGQARRLYIGIELVICPSVILLDEPLSGLDRNLLECLSEIARGGASVLLSIHQPSNQLFRALDSIIVLSQGDSLLQAAPSQIESSIDDCGLTVPDDLTLSEWILNIAQQDRMILENCRGLLEALAYPVFDSRDTSGAYEQNATCVNSSVELGKAIRWHQQVLLILIREFTRRIRRKDSLVMQVTASACAAVLLALVFQGVLDTNSPSLASFQSHVGLLMVVISLGGTIVGPAAILDFVEHRSMFEREFRSSFYSVQSFLFAMVIVELVTVLVQGLIFNLIAFWSIGFESRFWYFYLEYCAFGFGFLSSMLFLGSLLKNPNHTKSFIGVVIVPQVLLCGFYVTVSEMPPAVRWASMLMQLTYVFRLSLEEEFRFCGQPTAKETSILRCVSGLGRLFRDGGLYNSASTLTTDEAGQIQGKDAIEDFHSLVFTADPNEGFMHDTCWSASRIAIQINSANETFCDVTTANILSGDLSPVVFSSGGGTIQLTAGMRLAFTLQSDDITTIIDQSVYLIYPPHDTLPQLDPVKTAQYICTTMKRNCQAEILDFQDHASCVSKFLSLPLQDKDPSGRAILAGNTTGCRLIHSFLSNQNPSSHCRHLALSPNSACSSNYQDQLNQTFSPSDLRLFHKVAIANDLIDPTQLSQTRSNPRSSCHDISENDLFTALTEAGELGSLDPYCYSYLQANEATSNKTFSYWISTLMITLALRILAGFALKRRSSGLVQ